MLPQTDLSHFCLSIETTEVTPLDIQQIVQPLSFIMDHMELNDFGIYLLEQKCYRQAISFFRRAAKTIHKDIQLTCTETTNGTSIEKESIHLEPCPCSSPAKFYTIMLDSVSTINFIVDRMNPETPVSDHLTSARKTAVLSLSRIQSQTLPRAVRQHICSAVVLYNLAVTHWAYSDVSKHQGRFISCHMHRERAKRMWERAAIVLEMVSSILTHEDGYAYPIVLSVRLLVLLRLQAQPRQTRRPAPIREMESASIAELYYEASVMAKLYRISENQCIAACAA